MKDLRKYINENRDLFDDKEPSNGHMERFEALLDKQISKEYKPTVRVKIFRIISIAASIAIFVFIGLKVYTPHIGGEGDPLIGSDIGVVDEFQETNLYYSQQMEQQIADIMCKLAHTDSENQAQLTHDLKMIMDNNADFVEEIAKSENKELAIHYLVEHYQINIEILEGINEKLGKYNKC